MYSGRTVSQRRLHKPWQGGNNGPQNERTLWHCFSLVAADKIGAELEGSESLEETSSFTSRFEGAIDQEILNFVQNTITNGVVFREDLETMLQWFRDCDPLETKAKLLAMMAAK